MNRSDSTPLHQMEPLQRFSDRAEDYAKFRPSYPVEVITAILAGLGEPSHLIAADVGAGTGISSRLLADRGVTVWAIEPNAEMQQAADSHPIVTFHIGSAEHTGLAHASVDLVTCFQAFHWFEPVQSLTEFHRILKPSGRVALVWNNRDREDEFTQGYSHLVQQISNHHPAEQRLVAAEPLFTSPNFKDVQQQRFHYHQALDLIGLIGRAQSVSYIPKEDWAQEKLITGLTALYEQWADSQGLVYLSYCTQAFWAQKN